MKRSALVIAILVLAGILAFMLFFQKCGIDPVKPVVISPKDQVKAVEKIEAKNNIVTDSLAKENAIHIADAAKVKKDLAAANIKIGNLKIQLDKAIYKPPADISSEYTENLQVKYSDYSLEQQHRDSLSNEQLAAVESQLRNREALIIAKDTGYNQLRRAFIQSTNNLQSSIDYSKQLKKQVNKKKVSVIAWKIAAIAGGLVILKNAIQ